MGKSNYCLGYFRGGFIFTEFAQNVIFREIKNSAKIYQLNKAQFLIGWNSWGWQTRGRLISTKAGRFTLFEGGGGVGTANILYY